MKRSWLRGIVGLAAGILLAFGGYLWLYPTHFSPEARMAKSFGADPKNYHDVSVMQRKAQNDRALSEEEIAQLKALSEDTNKYVRVRAVSALSNLTDTPQAPEAMLIVRVRLTDTEWLVRQKALNALYKLKAPDVRTEAERMLHDSNSEVKSEANKILSRPTKSGV
jgi:outer membrane PBP1 activator LpoA protein